jgi:hypothetical protein
LVYVNIPLRPYLKKFLLRKERYNTYKEGWLPTVNTVLGLAIINLFSKKEKTNQLRPYYKSGAGDENLRVYVPERLLKKTGFNISDRSIGLFIQMVHRCFDEDLLYCIELTHHKVKKGLDRFMVLNGLDYEDYDAIVKSNYRYRKLFNVSLVSLDKICPVRMIAGIYTINYIPLSWINRSSSFMVPDAGYTNVGNIIPSPGKTILNMPAVFDSKSLEVSGESDENGAVLGGSLKCFYPAISQGLIAEMNKMVGVQFVAWASLPDNFDIILGDLNRGADFSFSANTNSKLGEKAGVDMTWTWHTGLVIYKSINL